jgi:putative transposase
MSRSPTGGVSLAEPTRPRTQFFPLDVILRCSVAFPHPIEGVALRCYPTEEQHAALERTFGCVRFVYNWALALRRETYAKRRHALTYDELSAALTRLKANPDHTWLHEVSSVPLQQALRHLSLAFQAFVERRGSYPVFKKKRGRQAGAYVASAFSWVGERITLGRMREPLDVRWSRRFSGRPPSVTVTRDPAGRYFISCVVEAEIALLPPSPRAVGIDLGVHALVATTDGTTIPGPRFFRRAEQRLARVHRALSRKRPGSRNRERARLELARAYAKVADCRNDLLHKLTTTLIHENQAICMEDLSVRTPLRNHSRVKSIGDAAWGELVRQLTYKAYGTGAR